MLCATYNCDYLPHTRFLRFCLIIFRLNTDFPFQFCVFTVKSPNVTQRSDFQDKAFKKSKNLLPFFRKTIGSNNSFSLIENIIRFFKIAKFEFKVTVHYGLWTKDTQL